MNTKNLGQKTSQSRQKDLTKKTESCDKISKNLSTEKVTKKKNWRLDKMTEIKIFQ